MSSKLLTLRTLLLTPFPVSNANFASCSHSSPSKIDQWCKPNVEVCESSPSKIEGVGGSMIPRRSPLSPLPSHLNIKAQPTLSSLLFPLT